MAIKEILQKVLSITIDLIILHHHVQKCYLLQWCKKNIYSVICITTDRRKLHMNDNNNNILPVDWFNRFFNLGGGRRGGRGLFDTTDLFRDFDDM